MVKKTLFVIAASAALLAAVLPAGAGASGRMDEFLAFAGEVADGELIGNYRMSANGDDAVIRLGAPEPGKRETAKLRNLSGMLHDAMPDFGLDEGHFIIDVEDGGETVALFADGIGE